MFGTHDPLLHVPRLSVRRVTRDLSVVCRLKRMWFGKSWTNESVAEMSNILYLRTHLVRVAAFADAEMMPNILRILELSDVGIMGNIATSSHFGDSEVRTAVNS